MEPPPAKEYLSSVCVCLYAVGLVEKAKPPVAGGGVRRRYIKASKTEPSSFSVRQILLSIPISLILPCKFRSVGLNIVNFE